MKRIYLLIVAAFITSLSFAQTIQLSETTVKSPSFQGYELFQYEALTASSPICQFLSQKINSNLISEQGIVSVLFTVNEDGSLTDFFIENSVSKSTDTYVVDCLESSSGYWVPGFVNGTPSKMEKRIQVSFYDPEKGTLNEQGNNNLQIAIKKYKTAMEFKDNIFISAQKANRKATQKLNQASELLKTAKKYIPNEPSVAFWQACVYELTGNQMRSKQKLDEFNLLTETKYHTQIESVHIDL